METSFLAYVRGRCRSLPQVAVGIGDDAAVFDPAGRRQVVCTDQIVDQVDFDLATQDPASIGFKSMAINVSDIAAMGARVDSALVTLTLPKQNANEIAGAVYEGILEVATRHQIAIIGGDLTTHDGPLAINVVLIGSLADHEEPWLRSGAAEGQAVFLTGPVGGSLLGRHLRPAPRIDFAAHLRSMVEVTAAIDVSDGLSLDLDRLCAASGVGVLLDVDAIPIHADAHQRAKTSGLSAFRHAWSDGEDFELLLTVSTEDAERIESFDWASRTKFDEEPVRPVRIGSTTSRTGLWTNDNGKHVRLPPQGYVH